MKRGLNMKNMKKVLSIILSFVVCITLFTGIVNADTTIDSDKMADVLNRLDILQGSNGDYLLYNNLDRAQATALIIRMLGKEDYVKENADELRSTKYPDVPQNSWYAPYVGYSTLHNIVAGDLAGNFTPLEKTTEKAFLKMALCALGYEYGTDFSWPNVYQKAYEVGIVTDLSYSTKTEDDRDYLRLQAVEVIYRSLNTFKKDSKTKMVFALVEEGVFTIEDIAASGLFGDEEMIAIEEITTTSPDTVEVKFSGNVWSLDAGDVDINDATQTDQVLEVKSAAIKENVVQIITAGQIPGRKYTLSINNITDTNGVISSDLTGTFTGYKSQQVTSDFFMISRVEQLTGKVINVYFTHPINISSENPAYYELIKSGNSVVTGTSQGMVVKKLNSVDNAVSIYLKDYAFELGEVYTLRVDGKLNSSYGVKLGEGYGEAKDFVATVEDSEQLEVLFVEAWTNNSVRIVFNREVDPAWAGRRLNYTIHDSNNSIIDVTKAVVSESGDDSGKEVMLSLSSPLYKTKKYEVRIEYIPDFYKQSIIEDKSFSFTGDYQVNKELELAGAFSEYSNSVIVAFTKPLDPVKASNKSSYNIRGKSDLTFNVAPEKAYYSEQNGMYSVKLFLPAGKTLSDSKTYTVYAYDMKDSLGNTYLGTLRGEFTGGSDADTKPRIIDAVTISKDAVKVTFNTEIAFEPNNISTTNYTLEYAANAETVKIVPFAVNYVNATTLVLRFDEMDPTIDYLIKFRSIMDYSEQYTRTSTDEYNTVNVRWGE